MNWVHDTSDDMTHGMAVSDLYPQVCGATGTELADFVMEVRAYVNVREQRAREAAWREKGQKEEAAGTKRKISFGSAEQEDGWEGSESDGFDDFVRDTRRNSKKSRDGSSSDGD